MNELSLFTGAGGGVLGKVIGVYRKGARYKEWRLADSTPRQDAPNSTAKADLALKLPLNDVSYGFEVADEITQSVGPW